MKQYSNVIIYGAGASGVLIKQLFDKEKITVIAFIDDNKKLHNRTLVGIKILHSSHLNQNFIFENSVDAIILSNIYVHLNQSEHLKTFNIPLLLPNDVSEWNQGNISSLNISEIDSSFIINRPVSVNLSQESLKKLAGKKILITGASGSIGSEITRQLNKHSNISLILIDIDESGLHDLYNSLKNKVNCIFHICDVSNLKELERLIVKYDDIDSIFHAAAYKHVPIVEVDPYPAIRVNIQGTLNLCLLVDKYKIKNFTLVSTDKAVNPTNIMGATKRCAEIITTYYNFNSKSIYRCTRFGNVIGSRGSAIPLFIEQIKNGGPVTLTHNNITRYFMTIPEATNLVIKSSLVDNSGGVFLFDMGDPIHLKEVIENLKLYFNKPNVKIDIIGLRSGEKMYEELNSANEKLFPTSDNKISLIKTKEPAKITIDRLYKFISEFKGLEISQIKISLKNIIPEYNIKN